MSDEEKLRKLREKFGGNEYKQCSCGTQYKKELKECPHCGNVKYEIKEIYPGMSL